MSLVFRDNFAIELYPNSAVSFTKYKKAYTEDNVVICNIFIYMVPNKFKELDVYRYFSRFGLVSDVRLVDYKEGSRRSSSKVGFVNFFHPESAYRALRKPIRCIQGSPIGVKARFSWKQPNAEQACNKEKPGNYMVSYTKQRNAEALNVDAKCAGLNVLELNDDCLETICGLLGLRDQIRFARVCPRFQEIFNMLSRREYKKVEFRKTKGMTLWETRDFFRFAGKNIVEVSGKPPNKNRNHIFAFITMFCVNLKRIALNYRNVNPDFLNKLVHRFPLLQQLDLKGCGLNDLSIQSLQTLNQLECLSLAENYALTGRFIGALVHLKVLNLHSCGSILPSYLLEICRAMPNLNSLDIRGCELLPAKFFQSMAEHCQQLEILKMSSPEFSYERVSLLPQLKHIELLLYNSLWVSHTQIFIGLAENKSQELETLKIYGANLFTAQQLSLISKLKKLKSFCCRNNLTIDDDALGKFCELEQLEELDIENCPNITNGALIKLLRSCKNLRHLNIQLCKNITNEFVSEAINILKDRKGRSQTPLVLIVYGTSIDNCGLSECEKYKTASKESLIKVVPQLVTDKFGIRGFRWDPWDGCAEEHNLTDEDDDFCFTYMDEEFDEPGKLFQ